jgi:hypothetical protein
VNKVRRSKAKLLLRTRMALQYQPRASESSSGENP